MATRRRQSPATASLAIDSKDELLVSIVNSARDLSIARDRHWYRIPVWSQKKWLGRRPWPPTWLAFYQTKLFGPEAFSVRYYARVIGARIAPRRELLPEEPNHPSADQPYHQLLLGELRTLARSISSIRWRRIVFIPTKGFKFCRAAEINDLYDDSPLEDMLWSQLKLLEVAAERQEFITANGSDYALDFAIYCDGGKLDVETDGDSWHADPARIPQDNRRDNDLETAGWKLLRFNGQQLHEEMTKYCLPAITKNVQKLGGVAEGRLIARDIPHGPGGESQLSLFDDQQLD
jgi:very-short-patch-repair endonuclease